MICKIDKKLSRNSIKISRYKVGKWLDKHPKSPWWILSTRVADFCMIDGEEKTHNTTILGKYLPRKKTFWQYEPGVSVLNGMRTVCWVIFYCALNSYWFCTILLVFVSSIYIYLCEYWQRKFCVSCVCLTLMFYAWLFDVRQEWEHGSGELANCLPFS